MSLCDRLVPQRQRVGTVLLLGMCAACYTWVRWEGPASAMPICRSQQVFAMLDTVPQPALSWTARKLAWVTTPWKRRGISGWRHTYCVGDVTGSLVRNAQRSTDGFWTLDLRLTSVRIDSVLLSPTDRFLRVEIEPRTLAHRIAQKNPLVRSAIVSVQGVIVIDTDRDGFLEIHPDSGFTIVSAGVTSR